MKNLLIGLFLVLPFLIHGQEAPAYAMYKNIYLTPQSDKIIALEENVAAHNKAFHSGGAYHVNVYRVTSGANFGKMVWSMGPHTWADIDARTPSDAHGEDWANDVVGLTKKVEDGGTWRMVPGDSYAPEGTQFDKLRIRIIDVRRGEVYRFHQIMQNLAETYKAKRPNQAHIIFDRVNATNDGREWVVVFGYNSWAEMDEGIVGDYEAVHGDGSWDRFQEEIEEIIESSEDELWARSAEMSGNPN